MNREMTSNVTYLLMMYVYADLKGDLLLEVVSHVCPHKDSAYGNPQRQCVWHPTKRVRMATHKDSAYGTCVLHVNVFMVLKQAYWIV